MARNISPASLNKLAQNFGTEPVNIIEVQWIQDQGFISYADKDIGTLPGKIQQMGGLDAVIKIASVTGSGGQSQSISVTLDDTDGSIREIYENNDIHKRTVRVFQAFDNIPLNERFLIFSGKISTPVEWSEADRTLKFDVVSEIEDKEVGFSPEEGRFFNISEDLLGQVWPMCFGRCIEIPAAQLDQIATGTSTRGIGVVDPSLSQNAARLRCFALIQDRAAQLLFILAAFAAGTGGGEEFILAQAVAAATTADENNAAALVLENALGEQRIALGGSLLLFGGVSSPTGDNRMEVIGGEDFPQGVPIDLIIGDIPVTGTFLGTDANPSNILEMSKITHPDIDEFTCGPPTDGLLIFIAAGGIVLGGGDPNTNQPNCPGECTSIGFAFAEGGSKVVLAGQDIRFVANHTTLPGTVLNVKAFREFEGVKRLTTVPNKLYTVSRENFGPIRADLVTLQGALSSREDEGWEDQLYVTYESTVGPNTVEEIEFLINNYTDKSIDAATFNKVRSQVANYPSHWPLLKRVSLVGLLEDIAWQARCALWLIGDTFFMRYLPEAGVPTETITEFDIDSKTLATTFTPTDELVTKFVAEWKRSHALDEPNKLLVRYNIRKYGTHERTYDFFIYNIQELVRKSATFWIIRYGNTWKTAQFTTALDKLNVETQDQITLDVPSAPVSNSPVLCDVAEASYDSNSNTVKMSLWTPVRAGEMEPYIFARPEVIAFDAVFPTKIERDNGAVGGDGPGAEAVGQDFFAPGTGRRVRFSVQPSDPDRRLIQNILRVSPSRLDAILANPTTLSVAMQNLAVKYNDRFRSNKLLPVTHNDKPRSLTGAAVKDKAENTFKRKDVGGPNPGDKGDENPGAPAVQKQTEIEVTTPDVADPGVIQAALVGSPSAPSTGIDEIILQDTLIKDKVTGLTAPLSSFFNSIRVVSGGPKLLMDFDNGLIFDRGENTTAAFATFMTKISPTDGAVFKTSNKFNDGTDTGQLALKFDTDSKEFAARIAFLKPTTV